ncbi:type IV pilus assembly protein PilM [Lignipirellula cremea]|nr:type IV pilus assembly protein PilM [Lignipirellula cremea]
MSNAVWGIDIGQCALKALRCTLDDDEKSIVADAYDYIEYPKILSQPEANREELIRDALEQFLSRNEVRGCKVAMSVPGQAGLSRFFKPPPVDAKLIPDIVKYEAKQQIPFPLEDVVWDFQKIGGTEVDGFTLDAEVGLFAMKREQVFRAIKPFTDAGIELSIVQLAPLCIYNYVSYDLLDGGPNPEEIDPDNPPESLVVLSIGTETTDLVITNGVRIWQRSIPLGGNHFTKQLSRELKMTYVKAEHLKRNARQAEDPKTVFQVMRPVFNDFVTEIQRSLNFFQNIDRQTKIGRLVMIGNTVRLPGLRQYLSKNLGLDVIKVDEFRHLKGGEVKSSPQFHENLLAYAGSYGLCLQALDVANLSTNLLPQEFITNRLIREKKPWAVAAVGAVLLAFSFNYLFHYGSFAKVEPAYANQGVDWRSATSTVDSVQNVSTSFKGEQETLKKTRDHFVAMGEEVVGAGDRKLLWLELYRAINSALPVDPRFAENPTAIRDPMKVPYLDRPDIYIRYIESQYFEDTARWWTPAIQKKWEEVSDQKSEGDAEGEDAGAAPPPVEPGMDPAMDPSMDPSMGGGQPQGEPGAAGGPTGPGWVIEIRGYHFHNSSTNVEGGSGYTYLRNTLIEQLKKGTVRLPKEAAVDGREPAMVEYTMEELGIRFPVVVENNDIEHRFQIKNERYVPPSVAGRNDGSGEDGAGVPRNDAAVVPDDGSNPQRFDAPKYEFVIQFCWQEKRLHERNEIREAAERAKADAEKALEAERQANAGNPEGGN